MEQLLNERLIISASLCLGASLVILNLWRALLFIRPAWRQVIIDDPGSVSTVPGALEPTRDLLVQSGFVSIGSHLVASPLSREELWFDFVNETSGTFAAIAQAPTALLLVERGLHWVPRAEREGPPVRVVFFTPSADAVLVSSIFRRPGAQDPKQYVSGSLENAPIDRLYRAHLRRVVEVGAPAGPWTLEARVDRERALLEHAGASEIRRWHASGLLWALGGIAVLIAPFVAQR